MNRFGEQLRFYRRKSADPERGGPMTQERLGSLLGDSLGNAGYTGAAISEWERGKSQIDKDYRSVLIGLIKIFYQAGGLHEPGEADSFLIAGNYRPLNEEERRQIFGEEQEKLSNLGGSSTDDPLLFATRLQSKTVRITANITKQILVNRTGGEPSHWSDVFLALLGRLFSGWTGEQLVQIILWMSIWLLTWSLTFPLLQWPFADQESAWVASLVFSGASITLPLFIGTLTNTTRNEFWKKQKLENSFVLRFYTFLGAEIGYQVGYMMIFAIALIGYYLNVPRLLHPLIGVGAIWPVILGYASAVEVPYNQWRAYDQLRFKDGAVFLVIVLIGPIFGALFYYYHYWLLIPQFGVPILLLAIGCLAALTVWQRQRGSTVIPAYIWVAMYGFLIVLQMIATGSNIYKILIFVVILSILIFLMASGRIRVTLFGAFCLLICSVILLILLYINQLLGLGAAILSILLWLFMRKNRLIE